MAVTNDKVVEGGNSYDGSEELDGSVLPGEEGRGEAVEKDSHMSSVFRNRETTAGVSVLHVGTDVTEAEVVDDCDEEYEGDGEDDVAWKDVELGRGETFTDECQDEDENKLGGNATHNSVTEGRENTSRYALLLSNGIEYLKYMYSSALLVFSVVVLTTAIFTGQTSANVTYGVPPLAAFAVFWIVVFWLGTVEGGLGCVVGLKSVQPATLYAESHKITFKVTSLAHRGDNLDRFIVGRQFLVVLLIFVANMMATITGSVLGLQGLAKAIFIDSGVALMLTTIVFGQLAPQVNGASFMLDFLNNYFMLFSTYVSLGIELSGLLHAVYIVQFLFGKYSGKPVESSEPPRNALRSVFHWTRVFLSVLILGFSLAVTLSALFRGHSGMWEGVPPVVSVVIFILLLCFVGCMEGLQIDAFALRNIKLDSEEEAASELAHRPMARSNLELLEGQSRLRSFLIGRQICVACCIFVAAKVTTVQIPEGEEEPNIFHLPDPVQSFVDTGLLGSIIITILGSLVWRIVARSFPVAFLSNPIMYFVIQLCLVLERTGICSASIPLAKVQEWVWKYRMDEGYLGTTKGEREEEAAEAAENEEAVNEAWVQERPDKVEAVNAESNNSAVTLKKPEP